MAAPRIFVSSTCYDLQEVRGNLRDFIYGFGYEPIMSDFGDIFYDFNTHVQQSCIDAIKQSDLYVLIVGDNYGSSFHTNEKKHNEIPDSVTLKEFKEALDLEKSRIVFVNKYVDYDYNNYKRYLRENYTEFFSENDVLAEDIENKKNEIRENVERMYPYPKKSYKYIFYFSDKIYEQKVGNAIHTFESSHDIKETLKKQWAGFVQESLKKREELNSPVANESKRVLEKLNKIERLLEDLNLKEILTTKNDKTFSSINDFIFDEKFNEKQNIFYESLENILMFEDFNYIIADYEMSYRFIFEFEPDREDIYRWMNTLEEITKKYKWAKTISSNEVFEGQQIVMNSESTQEIEYKYIAMFSNLYENLNDVEKEIFINTLELELKKVRCIYRDLEENK